jgi:hypothetical protein
MNAPPSPVSDGALSPEARLLANQRRALTRRAALVELLYAGPPVPGAIVAEGTP